MKRQSPFPSMATVIAEMRAREAGVNRCCGASGNHDVPDAILASKRWPAASAPRKGGSPPPVFESTAPALCACADEVTPPPERRPRRGVRTLPRSWLVAQGILDETPEQDAPEELRLDDESWYALQAALAGPARWKRGRSRVRAAREEVWPTQPEQTSGPFRLQPGSGSLVGQQGGTLPCACLQQVVAGSRYVDARDGDDANPGTLVALGGKLEVRPWKTLRRVEYWLNEEVYGGAEPAWTCVVGAQVFFRRGRTWNGLEERVSTSSSLTYIDWASPPTNAYGDQAILTIRELKATEVRPLVLSSYGGGESDQPGPSTGSAPLIQGSATTGHEPQYGDTRLGIAFYDCCHVYVHGLRIAGFGEALSARLGSRDHLYESLSVFDNARIGIGFGVTEENVEAVYAESILDKDYTAALAWIVDTRRYPVEIAVIDSLLWSNGYDTGGSDVAIGHLATNCTIRGSRMWGDDVRGVDGIVSQGGSSGHLIADNRIWSHSKQCRSNYTDPTSGLQSLDSTFARSADCGGAASTWVLYHRCPADLPWTTSSVCTATAYGYQDRYEGGSLPAGGGQEGFAEDGIDLKGVRPRTPLSEETTVVSGNVIWGHGHFAGITINDGSQDIHVYRNRIFQNATGVLITNSKNSAWYNTTTTPIERTGQVFVYRNLIYMNEGRGIQVEVEDTSYPLGRVYIVNNTVAHNLLTGVNVVNNGGVDALRQLSLLNNLIARNGISGGGDAEQAQVAWQENIPALPHRKSIWYHRSDYNCYLGWSSIGKEVFWKAGGGLKPFADVQADWGVEAHGLAAAVLADLDLAAESVGGTLSVMETMPYGTEGDNLFNTVTTSAPDVLEALDYDIGAGSVCRELGTDDSGVDLVDLGIDLAMFDDFNGDYVVAAPDIGAFEFFPGSSKDDVPIVITPPIMARTGP